MAEILEEEDMVAAVAAMATVVGTAAQAVVLVVHRIREGILRGLRAEVVTIEGHLRVTDRVLATALLELHREARMARVHKVMAPRVIRVSSVRADNIVSLSTVANMASHPASIRLMDTSLM